MRLKGKTVMITGAGRGIGKSAALMMAEQGADLILCDISDDVNQAAEEIRALGVKAYPFVCNVTDRQSVEATFAAALEAAGRIDALVNNAGITADATMMKMTDEQWDRVIDVNLKGTFLVGQAAAKAMTENGGAIIIPNAKGYVLFNANVGTTGIVKYPFKFKALASHGFDKYR